MSGRLAAAAPPTNTPTTLYTVPANTLVSITLAACNRGTAQDRISIQLCEGAPGSEDYIEYNTAVWSYTVLERSGIIMATGQSVVVTTETGQTSFLAWGITEDL